MKVTLATLEVIKVIRSQQRLVSDAARNVEISSALVQTLARPTTPEEALDRALDAVLALASEDQP